MSGADEQKVVESTINRESDAISALMLLCDSHTPIDESAMDDSNTNTSSSDVIFIEYIRNTAENVPIAETNTPLEAPPTLVVPSSPSSSSSSVLPQTTSPVGVMGRLNVTGFESVKSYMAAAALTHERQDKVYLDLDKTRLTLGGNPAFCIDDSPLPGWRKEIYIRMAGHMRGSAEVAYASPDRSRRIRTKIELAKYLSQCRTPLQQMVLFNFDKVYCVCHQPECRRYLECSFGKGGCNGWVHSECVGLGVRSAIELSQMKRVICPLCYHYLTGTGELENYANDATVIREFGGEAANSTAINGFEVEECPIGHTSWGLSGDCDLAEEEVQEHNGQQQLAGVASEHGDVTMVGEMDVEAGPSLIGEGGSEELEVPLERVPSGTVAQSVADGNVASAAVKAKKVNSSRFTFTHSLLGNAPVQVNPARSSNAPSNNSNNNSSSSSVTGNKSSQSKRKLQEMDQSVSNILQHRLFQFSSVVPADIEQAIRQPASKKYQYQTPLPVLQPAVSGNSKKPSGKKSPAASRVSQHSSVSSTAQSDSEEEEEDLWDDSVLPQDRVYEHTIEIKTEKSSSEGLTEEAMVVKEGVEGTTLTVSSSDGSVAIPPVVVQSKKILIRVTGGWMKKPSILNGLSETKPPIKTDDESMDAGELKALILSKAAAAKQRAREFNQTMTIHDKIRRSLIESTQQLVHSLRKNKKTRSSAAAQAAADTFHLRPSHCYLPLADGGLRFVPLSFGEGSLMTPQLALPHQEDEAGGKSGAGMPPTSSRFGVLCGFCFNSFPNTAFTPLQSHAVPAASSNDVGSSSSTKDSQGNKQNKKLRSAGPSLASLTESSPVLGQDALTVVEYDTPDLTCCMHKSCAHLLNRLQKGEAMSWLSANESVTVGRIIECPRAAKSSSGRKGQRNQDSDSDDNESDSDEEPQSFECNLCGRSGEGGVMQEVSVRAATTSGGVGMDGKSEGLLLLQGLAHIPCIFYLTRSAALQPFHASVQEEDMLKNHFPTRFLYEDNEELEKQREISPDNNEDQNKMLLEDIDSAVVSHDVINPETDNSREEDEKEANKQVVAEEEKEEEEVEEVEEGDVEVEIRDDDTSCANHSAASESQSPDGLTCLPVDTGDQVIDMREVIDLCSCVEEPVRTTVDLTTDWMPRKAVVMDLTSNEPLVAAAAADDDDDDETGVKIEPEPVSEQSDGVVVDPEREIDAVVPQPPSLEALAESKLWSSFERQYAAHRCSICGLQAGLTLRCSAAGCCTYCHPLCVAETKHNNYFPQKGVVCNIGVKKGDKGESESQSLFGFVCWFHTSY